MKGKLPADHGGSLSCFMDGAWHMGPDSFPADLSGKRPTELVGRRMKSVEQSVRVRI